MIKTILKHCKTKLVMAWLPLLLFASSAQALPSFSRQTGEACTACHVQTWGANLTSRGREFKLKGYTEGEGKWIPPLSVVAEGGGFLNLDDKNPLSSFLGLGDRSYFNGSVFYAGKVAGPVGAYVEGSYAHDPESGAGTGFLNKVDLRFANQVKVAGHQIDYGISVNNEPGVQDLWNTNEVWSPLSVGFIDTHLITGPQWPGHGIVLDPRPLSDRLLSGHVAGASMYPMVNNLLYLEAGGYAWLPRDVQTGIGRDNFSGNAQYYGFLGDKRIDGASPYWRIALQHNWDGHYLALGHFGQQADVRYFANGDFANRPPAKPTSVTDLGLDATYQYLSNPEHIFELKGRYTRESKLNNQWLLQGRDVWASILLNRTELTTESFNVNASYTWLQTLGLSVAYHQYAAPKALVLKGPNTIDLNYLTTELSYTPFGKQNSLAASLTNLRLSLTYMTALHSLDFVTPQDSLYLSGRLAF